MKAQATDAAFWNRLEKIRLVDTDSAAMVLSNYYDSFMLKKDTLSAINSLTRMASVYGTQAQYKNSYDQLWKALFLADEANLEKQKAYIIRRIGRYYAFYKRQAEALHFLNQALSLEKSLVVDGVNDTAALSQIYSPISLTYQEMGELEKAQIYLDSCFLYTSKGKGGKKIPFLEVEQAFILCKDGKYQAAITLLEKNVTWMEQRLPSYLVLIYSYLGDAYKGKEALATAEAYYKESLETSARYNSHLDFSVLVRESLSDLYAIQGRYAAAFEQLKIAKQLDKLYFDSRSINNRPLLEIQDEFREELEHKKQLLKEQRLAQLEHDNEVNLLQKIMVTILLLSILFSSVIYFYNLKKRHRAEKQMVKKERELELQKNKELLSVKNKELTTFTLKLIEKDEFLSELKEKIDGKNEDLSLQEVKRIIRKININSTENWEEFEAKFIDVNKAFYENLRSHFPNLTRGDRKLCALLKLNLSSKEMARLMGISVESVHTTRYRLRKKLGLEKGEDLNDFMAQF
ncbi:MAG: hypothetical protein AAF847_05035 [Bacteroidota bacterium]